MPLDGDWRVVELRGEWYVLGHNSVVPCGSERAAVRTLVLIRMRPPPLYDVQMSTIVSRDFGGEIVIAEDGSEIVPLVILEEFILQADGSFSVTWQPFEVELVTVNEGRPQHWSDFPSSMDSSELIMRTLLSSVRRGPGTKFELSPHY